VAPSEVPISLFGAAQTEGLVAQGLWVGKPSASLAEKNASLTEKNACVSCR